MTAPMMPQAPMGQPPMGGAPMAPPPPGPPPKPPWTPFPIKANDKEPDIARKWRQRLSKVMDTVKFSQMPVEWQQCLVEKYEAAFMVEAQAAAPPPEEAGKPPQKSSGSNPTQPKQPQQPSQPTQHSGEAPV